jgi:hypothetical protein
MFRHHQEARDWASEILTDRTTFAVDGSQLMPSKEVSVPVAVVQVSWFLNPHTTKRAFVKQLQTEIIGPRELLASGSDDKLFHDQYISLKRYQMETQLLQKLCGEVEATEPVPIGFFDGSLLVSFAEVLIELHRSAYLDAAKKLLETSAKTRVPILGYVDTSAARDLIRMLSFFFYREVPPKGEGLSDIDVCDLLLPRWGDRTVAFRLARPGIQREYGEAGQGIGFYYLRTSSQRPPTRIEFPFWMLKADLLDTMTNVILAEAAIGNGYPYALETADQIAWIAPQDRSRFNRILQQFLQQDQIDLQTSNKMKSKQRRRISI